MKLPFYHVNAFSDAPFKGNPAAVFVLQSWLSEELMQAIAAEFNLSETVFSVLEAGRYHIRWFTPKAEVKLCGHATLATSHVLHQHMGLAGATIDYQSLSGPLSSEHRNGLYTLNFPANIPADVARPAELHDILGGGTRIKHTLQASEKLVVVLEDEANIVGLAPDFRAMAKLPYKAVCVTAPASTDGLDFVCRFFAPAIGIDEDPVTGSAYTMLAPYYASTTGRRHFKARQLSTRSGDIGLEVQGDRVLISGHAHTLMSGNYFLNE